MNAHVNSIYAYEVHDHKGTKAAVLGALSAAGSRGLCCEELEDRLGDAHNTISAACTHLRKGYAGAPLICWTGQKVRTRSGRSAGRMRLVLAGEIVAAEPVKKRLPRSASSSSVFTNGNANSAAAARSMTGAAQAQEVKVLDALLINRTADQIAMVTGLRPQSVTARLRALKARGLVRETGATRMTRKNRPAAVLERVTPMLGLTH
ncbi:winged helix-like DNA-binding protein [Brevundimonas phage vB_BpoS-Kabachok]|uniref:Winged helix-like DNA-binding protein n=1 Tax=Brevundimonas phage vB_BpoS-Kabachok TaxID=2948600 RepID=A0A9E7MPD8_9CAUD|nr:winged helix-like DNA-binding protein [Brevundimonas phage vB_BpoS-Kabachok]